VLADVAQEIHDRHRAEPVVVVDHLRGVRAVEVQKTAQLRREAGEVALQRLVGQQRALRGLARRIADETGAAADDRDGPVPGALQAHEVRHGQQAADVQ
jgi:hypothetical protein